MAWNHKSRVVAVGIAIQAVAGVFTAPSASDLVPVSPPTNSEEIISTEDPTATGSVWQAPRIYLGKTGTISFTAPLRGPGGSAPFAANAWPLGRVFQSAGWAEVINDDAIVAETQAGSTVSALALAAAEPATDDIYVGFPIQMDDIGTGAVKGTSLISSYNGTTKVADIGETLAGAPATGATYTIPPAVVYQLGTLTVSPPILSVSVWRDKKRYDYRDVRVSQFTIDMPVANEQNQVFPSVECTLRGLVEDVADEVSPALSSDLLAVPVAPYRNGKYMLDRVMLGHQSTRFQITADVAGASNANAEQGQDQYEIMSGNRTLDMDLNQMAVTDFDLESRVNNQTTISQQCVWGMGPGNRFGFMAPEIVLNPMNNPGDRNGFVNLTGNAAFVGVEKGATFAIWW